MVDDVVHELLAARQEGMGERQHTTDKKKATCKIEEISQAISDKQQAKLTGK